MSSVRKRRGLGWLISMFLHGSFLVVLALWMVPPSLRLSGFLELDTRISTDSESLTFSPFETVVETKLESRSSSRGLFSEPSPQPISRMNQENMEMRSIGTVANMSHLGLEIDNSGTSGFFGVTAKGDRVVYIVDASQSMEGARFRRVRRELIRSLQRLQSTQEFFVFFYNHQTYPLPMQKWVPATQRNLNKAIGWIRDVSPYGATVPGPSLKFALNMNPDVIFLLSDGKFDSGIIPWVRSGNTQHVAIHTIGFADAIGEPVLKALAEQSGGQYRFVP